MDTEKVLEKELESIDLGSHQCFLYEFKEEQLSLVVSFMKIGLERNEKCLYIADDRTKEEVKNALKDSGIQIEELIDSGQFEFLTKDESYLKNGYFDPDEMIDLLKNAEEEALQQGYNGLRGTGEMTWFNTDVPGTERLMEYETKLNDFLEDSKSIALCQYNEKKFEPEVLIDVIHTHPRIILHGSLHKNPYYMPPDVFDAQIRGEVRRKHYERVKKAIIERSKLKEEREQAREKLEESEERYRKLFETAQDGMLILNAETGEIKDANPYIQDLLGYSKEELVGKELWQIGTFRNIAENKEKFEELVDEGYIRYEDLPLETKSGEEAPVEFISNTYQADGEKVVQCNIRNISERKEAEKALEHLVKSMAEATRQDLFDSIVEELCNWLDVDGAFVGEIEEDGETVSSLSMMLDGKKIDDYKYTLPGAPCEKVVETGPCLYSENVTEEFPEDEELKELGVKGYLGVPIHSRKGERIGIIWGISRDRIENLPPNWEELLKIIGSRVAAEIERTQVEERLQESVAKFRNLVNISPDAILLADTETGEIIDANEEAENLLKKDKKEIIGMEQTEIHPEDEKEKYRQLFEEAAKEETVDHGFSEDFHIVDSEGEKIPVEVRTAKLKLGDREILQGIFHDIRRRKEFRRRKFFYSLLRQDMKNKLGTATGYLQLLEDAEISSESKEYLEKAIKALDEGSELVELVEEIASTDEETGGEQDPLKIVGSSIEENENLVEEKGVEIQRDLQNISSNVRGGYSLKKLFTHLLKTRIQTEKTTKIRITGREENDKVVLRVEDDGKKIPEDAKRRMSEETYDGQTSGIAGPVYFVLREILENFDGEIQFKDSELGGARFDVLLKKG